jgi:polysaccharide biosynthesis protein PslH
VLNYLYVRDIIVVREGTFILIREYVEMRLLFVMASYLSSRRTGSGIIAYNNLKELSKHHSIYFITTGVIDELNELSNHIEQLEVVARRNYTDFIKLLRKIYYLLLGYPDFLSVHKSREMERRVKEVIERNNFDAILLYEIHAIQYCPVYIYNKLIVNVEDPYSIKLSRMVRLPIWSFWQKVKLFVYARLAKQYEQRVFPKMGKVLVLSKTDMQDMQEEAGYNNIGCVSYGVAKRSKEKIIDYEGRTEGMIIFSGNMFHPPNVDGAVFFLQYVFLKILQDYSTAILWIVGAEPDIRIRDAAVCLGRHVVITGRVNDMAEYLQLAKVSICPVRLKIGVQTKILESLAWGTPVVTTNAGNSGIGGYSGRELWVEDDPNIFANRVVALLRGEGWDRLSQAGREFVEEHFSWERSGKELEQHIVRMQKANG